MPQHILIAGAGLMGRLAAATLSMQGHRVEVFDSARPEHRAAAVTSAGMLSPLAEMEVGGDEIALMGWESIEAWKIWQQRLLAEGLPGLGLVCQDSLLVFHPREAAVAERSLRRMPAEQIRRLARGEPAALEPMVSPDLAGALLPGEAFLEPRLALESLRQYAEGRPAPAQFHLDRPVAQIAPRELVLEGGERRGADEVWDCRGLGARAEMAVRGVRGETMLLRWPESLPTQKDNASLLPQRSIRRLHPRWRVYLVPRPGRELLVGATEIESEHRGPITAESSIDLLGAAIQVMPSLAEAAIVATDSNLRPALPDNRPIALAEPGLRRFNGLFRHGWLVAPGLLARHLVEHPLPGTADSVPQPIATPA